MERRSFRQEWTWTYASPQPILRLERDVLVGDGGRSGWFWFGCRCALIEVIGCATTGAAAGALTASPTFAASTEQDHGGCHDLGHVLFLIGLLVIPAAGLQAAFDVDLVALLEIFPGDFGHALPEHDVVPLGAFLPLPTFVLVGLVGSQRNLRYCGALRRVLDFRVFAQIANEDDFVDALCHECGLLRKAQYSRIRQVEIVVCGRGRCDGRTGIVAPQSDTLSPKLMDRKDRNQKRLEDRTGVPHLRRTRTIVIRHA